MKKCPKCDADIEELRTACPFCGTVLKQESNSQDFNNNNNSYNQYNQYNNNYRPRPISSDSGSIGYWLLGFFIPIVGIILYFVWKDEQPNNAKKCLWGALISIISSFVLSLLLTICGIIGIIAGGGM